MADFLISPAEHSAPVKSLGRISTAPERYGADILWWDSAIKGWVGVQRKAVPDLIASVQDGRLAKEVAQLMKCKVASVIVEGHTRWSTDGQLMRSHVRWSRTQHRSLIRSVQGRGIFVEHSDSIADTVKLVREIASWAHKGDHTSLDRRPGPSGDGWGRVTDKAWACHLLQSIPDIGPVQAGAIYDHFEGVVPVTLTATRDELLAVHGLGPKRVDKILRAFGR
jgi:ERCC4-type nuclease